MSNPLVAQPKDSTQAWSGISIVEDAEALKKGIESGDWASTVMGVAGTAMDALAFVADPFGSILAAGVGWLMEHVGPLKEALDKLTGSPDQVTALSETWGNIAKELGEVSTDLANQVKADIQSWTGPGADAYRGQADEVAKTLEAASKACDGASSGVKTAGEVVAAVRMLVRDTIAQVVGHMISWALQVLFTLGIGLAWVVPQVVNLVAKTARELASLMKNLTKALGELGKLLSKAGGLFKTAAKGMRDLKPGKAAKPDDVGTLPAGAKNLDPVGDRTTASGAGHKNSSEDTTPPPERNDAVGKDKRYCESDPVDVMTGDVLVSETDAELAGMPVLERTHLSSYRGGQWFGENWTSTLDQRLLVGAERIRYFSPDGMILSYPVPADGAETLPLEGPRWPLAATGTGYRLDTRDASLFFGPRAAPGVQPLVAVEQDGGRTDITHTPAGAPSELRHSDGRVIRLRGTRTRITGIEVIDAATGESVQVATFGYDDFGRLVQLVNASGVAARYQYDQHGRITGWLDRTGTWYRYEYDENGRCVRTLGPDGYFSGTFAYDRERLITVYTDSLGASTEYHFSAARQLSRRVDPLGNVTAYTWDRYDRLLTRTDPLGLTTSYGYDAVGALESVTRPDGSVLWISQDADGLTIETDEGLTRFYPRDEAPDPFEETLGVSRGLSEDQASRRRPRPAAEPAERDLFGRPKSVLNSSGRPVVLGWTVDGQERLRAQPSGVQETRRYDPEGHELERVNGAGFASRTEYGPFGLRTATVDEAGARTTYAYDTELRLVAVTNPNGLTWSYRFDAAGQLIEETDFDGRTLRFAYDRAGRVVQTWNGAGERTEYRYDELGNVIERRCPTGTTYYGYDAVGRMTSAVIGDAELRVTYDLQGRVLAESVDGRTLTHTYAADGTVTRRTPSGVDSAWRFDANGRPVSLTVAGHTLSFGYEGGRETTRTVDAAVTLGQSFDADDNLVGQFVRAGQAPPRQRRFTYRRDGLLTGIDDDVAGQTRFVLDAAGRVLQRNTPRGSEVYGYDGAGNIVEAREPAPTAGPRRYANNRLLSAGAVGFEYDAEGRVTARHEGGRVWRYVWDGNDRLIALATPEGHQWFYRYDPLGRRIGKQRVTTTPAGARVVAEYYEFTWSGALLVEQVHVDERQTRHVTVWEYHPEDERPLVQLHRSSTVDDRFLAIVSDLQCRPTELVDTAGSLVWQGDPALWGRENAPAATPLRFRGHYADAESGLHYNVYRYYDPTTGRYLSQDPLGLVPAPNPAAYVPNPLAAADPLGLMKPCEEEAAKKNKKGNKRPGAGNDASNLPESSTTPSASKDTHELYNDGNVKVQVDSHQGKHQVGNTSFGMKYNGGKGTKFPGYVGDKWHQDYFSKEAARHTKEGPAGRMDADIAAKKDKLDEAKYEKDAYENAFKNKQEEYKNAPKEARDGIRKEAAEIKEQYQQAAKDHDQAQKDYDAANAERESYDGNNKNIQYPKGAPKDDGVHYDMSSYWDKDNGQWVTTYHCNPADNNWDKNFGKAIGKANGLS
ncbi:hypothetical protein FPZ12_003985 [Amycolatopsis acidicola]|uniref:Type IV secretion protein Rhs n=1 Tax=Amycolatopsis acidicola TaxID=2596893 RepID=A0A5N0VMV0_9PSEU|nr:RHS repeat-associated core domain-containing protein [Amycolatopsis acidicola]KAA9166112.1 hypothetical protein FPZ12_003985 [Amycolatopsis acidicola]